MKCRVAIALGSNLGDRTGHIAAARDSLRRIACTDQPFLQAPLYESTPVDCPPDARPFLNTTIECSFGNPKPLELLELCRQLESAAGRPARRSPNAPRTLDLDLLYIDHLAFDHPELQLPHPRMAQRPFVLAPLADIAPDHIPAGWSQSIADTLKQITDAHSGLTLFSHQW